MRQSAAPGRAVPNPDGSLAAAFALTCIVPALLVAASYPVPTAACLAGAAAATALTKLRSRRGAPAADTRSLTARWRRGPRPHVDS
ncbi:hypothetical protein [Halobaculum sp. D14]|uniref:hypothetical protein n=1 Tax=Halobaculum sp. D14 TaxID=3421642 RepID=UPI003EBCC07F